MKLFFRLIERRRTTSRTSLTRWWCGTRPPTPTTRPKAARRTSSASSSRRRTSSWACTRGSDFRWSDRRTRTRRRPPDARSWRSRSPAKTISLWGWLIEITKMFLMGHSQLLFLYFRRFEVVHRKQNLQWCNLISLGALNWLTQSLRIALKACVRSLNIIRAINQSYRSRCTRRTKLRWPIFRKMRLKLKIFLKWAISGLFCIFSSFSHRYSITYWQVDTWLTEFRIDQIRVVLQKGYVLYV